MPRRSIIPALGGNLCKTKGRVLTILISAIPFLLSLLLLMFLVGRLESPSHWNSELSVVQDEVANRVTCAPWIRDRKVLFLGMKGWPYDGRTGGENYLGACLDYALHRNGFDVEHMHHKHFRDDGTISLSPQKLASYHRIVFSGPRWSNRFDEREVGCKVRSLHWWGNWNDHANVPFDPRQVLSPYPDEYNTFIGFFPHSLLGGERPLPRKERGRVGLIMGKSPEYFTKYRDLIESLLSHNFTIHVTCRDRKDEPCHIPDGVIRHKMVGPREFESLLPKVAFMLGLANPVIPPSPLLGLAHGVAFLNPYRGDMKVIEEDPMLQSFPLKRSATTTQHDAIAMLGMPYVYNVNLRNISDVVAAAERAVRYRFASYTPWEFRPEAMVQRVCGMMEDDALCLCPNPVFGKGNKRVGVGEKNVDPDLDCRGSSYVRIVPSS